MSREWFRDFFDRDYVAVLEYQKPAAQTRQEHEPHDGHEGQKGEEVGLGKFHRASPQGTCISRVRRSRISVAKSPSAGHTSHIISSSHWA